MHLTSLLPLLFVPSTLAWGMLGHRTTAVLASRFLDPEAASTIRTLLSPQSMITASTWADYYAHTPEGRYSAPWHWIDARDSPPHSCGVTYSRDCPSDTGCIVSAIANNTMVAMGATPGDRAMALKWVIHFLGDIHQPLHTEDLLRGGNSISVSFGGRTTNLHHVWDSSIAEKMRGGNSIRHAVSWADELHSAVVSGRYGNVTESWGTCLDPAKGEECAIEWATETNQWMCKYVLPATYPEGFAGSELDQEYYQGAKEIVEAQVAIAGWRMAGWLNAMFAGGDKMEEMMARATAGRTNALFDEEVYGEL